MLRPGFLARLAICTRPDTMVESDSDLRELVRRFRVTWETRPEMGPSGHSVSAIGYVLELNAIPEDPAEAAKLSCPDCRAVEEALERLVQAIAPSEVVHVRRGSRQLGAAHDSAPEVSATVTVLHHDGKGDNRPADSGEQERLARLVDRLRALGAQERHWRDEPIAAASS